MNYKKQIKRHYGENMYKLCKEMFPSLTDEEIFNALKSEFAYSKKLYDDITNNIMTSEFKNLINYRTIKEKKELKTTDKTPSELLDEAGYTLYKCQTEKEIQSFKKYYQKDEEICTFKGGRLERALVFFAVKKNVNDIKREDFTDPKIDDEYSKSVISIQMSRDQYNTLKIISRYNHALDKGKEDDKEKKNPDTTFNNDLEEIIPGLTDSFNRNYNLNINAVCPPNFELPNYIKAENGKYYKYNYEINNIFYCTNNDIITNYEAKSFPKEKYIVFDYFVLDLDNKKIIQMDNSIQDSFINSIGEINSITHEVDEKTKNRIIVINDNIKLVINKENKLIGYENNNIIDVDSNFLSKNEYLEYISLPNAKTIGRSFLENNKKLKSVNLPKVEVIKDYFLSNNLELDEIDLPSVKQIGHDFMFFNKKMKKISMPNVIDIQNCFLCNNNGIEEINMLRLKSVGNSFMDNNVILTKFNAPLLEIISSDFLYCNENLEKIILPNVINIGNNFLCNNKILYDLEMPNVKNIGNDFLCWNNALTRVTFESLEKIGNNCLENNNIIKEFIAPLLQNIGRSFLKCAKNIKNFIVGALDEVNMLRLQDYLRELLNNKGCAVR